MKRIMLLLIGLCILIGITLFLVDYKACVVFTALLLLGYLLGRRQRLDLDHKANHHTSTEKRGQGLVEFGNILGLLAVVGVVFLGANADSGVNRMLRLAAGQTDIPLKRYTARIHLQPADGCFSVSESVVIDLSALKPRAVAHRGNRKLSGQLKGERTFVPPVRKLESRSCGWIVRECAFMALSGDQSSLTTFGLPGGIVVTGFPSVASSSLTSIDLVDLPVGSFVGARDAASLTVYPYRGMGTETISWQLKDFARGAAFTYVNAPYRDVRNWLQCLQDVASGFAAALALLGATLGYFLGWIARRSSARTPESNVNNGAGKV